MLVFDFHFISQISSDDGLILELKCVFRHILANVITRLRRVDMQRLFTYKLNSILFNHIKDFASGASMPENNTPNATTTTMQDRVARQHDLLKAIVETSTGGECHVALQSRHHELSYLRTLCKQMLPLLLPDYVHKCK